MADQGNGLHGLSQSHFVCQNSVQVVVVERNKPLQPSHLEGFQSATVHYRWLVQDCLFDAVCQSFVNAIGLVESVLEGIVLALLGIAETHFRLVGWLSFLSQHLAAEFGYELVGLLYNVLDLGILGLANDFEVLPHVVLLQRLHLSLPNLVVRLPSFALVLGLHCDLLTLLQPLSVVVEKVLAVNLQLLVEQLYTLFLPHLVVKQRVGIYVDLVVLLRLVQLPCRPIHPVLRPIKQEPLQHGSLVLNPPEYFLLQPLIKRIAVQKLELKL